MAKKIGIVGLGLIGGSLARAFKKYGKAYIVACDVDKQSLEKAIQDGVADCTGQENLRGCDVVFVCTGADRVVQDINAVFTLTGTSTLITDVCSVKNLSEINPKAKYIGGHPMAGTEKSGYQNSSAELFSGKCFVITEGQNVSRQDRDMLCGLVSEIGCKPFEWEDNAAHDRAAGKVSHLPHVLAYLMADFCTEDERCKILAGGGFKDTTRIASSDPVLWTQIILANKGVAQVIKEFEARLAELRQAIEEMDREKIQKTFCKGKEGRDSIC